MKTLPAKTAPRPGTVVMEAPPGAARRHLWPAALFALALFGLGLGFLYVQGLKTGPSFTPMETALPLAAPPRKIRPSGRLSLNAKPWAYVEINGKRYETPIVALPLPGGSYTARVYNPTLKVERSVPFQIRANETSTMLIDLTKSD